MNKSRAKGNDDGSRWGRGTVKKIAMRPANAGLRVWHRGQADEELLPAAWPALVERDEWETAVAILSDPARNRERPASRQHLLTWGIGECGVCGAHLRVAKRSAAKLLLYVCDSPRGCVGRSEAAVDDLVRRIAIARLARPDALDWLRRKDDGAHEAAQLADDLRARLDHAADAYAEGRIDARQLERITARLRPDLEDALARSRVRALTVSDETLAAMAGPAAEDAWRGASLAVRRAVLETLGMTVRIMPVKRRGPGFDPESVEIAWVQS
ncbi:MAG: recombinase family protein [Kineosporiaceae bacterium]